MIKFKLEIFKNEYSPFEVDGDIIPTNYYYIMDLISGRLIYFSKDFNKIYDLKTRILRSYKVIGEKLLKLMCSEQFLQTGKIDPVVFLMNSSANKIDGGFNWDDSILGASFWVNVLYERMYHIGNIAHDICSEILEDEISWIYLLGLYIL